MFLALLLWLLDLGLGGCCAFVGFPGLSDVVLVVGCWLLI